MGFLAVAMVDTKDLRPKGFPKFMGNDFFLIGYRIFVRYIDQRDKRLRGLYIIKSETNKKLMQLMGNLFTHYNYSSTDIKHRKTDKGIEIKSVKSDFKLNIVTTKNTEITLPNSSPFTNWKKARRFAGPLPYTFTYNTEKKEVLIIEGVRQNWKPKAVEVLDYKFSFIDSLKFKEIHLANAFSITDVPYYWKKGKIELWS
ncbi:DUF2071 domain-containing protein [Leeuwenhoekiella sp. W20_SRS_FM14]|uniref:DUF2071 domain-containing protein n=1 Tax=Leeuwenhoekiella sp. W20_SRS_FM14 TaxID=3240270 RepID=UPI003F9E9E50